MTTEEMGMELPATTSKALTGLDYTRETVMVWCKECPEWWALRLGPSRVPAWKAAAHHESLVHQGMGNALSALNLAAKREASATPKTIKTCDVEACDRPHFAKGQCLSHYRRACRESAKAAGRGGGGQ